jgi:acetyltransferase
VNSRLGTKNLNRIFNPTGIAVIGASEREGSVGAKILHNLLTSGYAGKIYPVNPYRKTVQGVPAYPSISKVPERVDLAIIATPAHLVPQIVEECGLAQTSGIAIVSAGFKIVGKTTELEQKTRELQKKYSIRLLGPNSFGLIRPKINLFATFADKQAIPGKIAFISQSGALCASVLDWAWENQVGFSAIVSTGSMLDIDLADLIDYFETDPQTKTLMLYVESIKDPRKFMSAVRQFAREKSVVLVKAGRFQETREATLSHSGSLAGEDAVYDAAFKRAGIVRVETISDLFNCAVALSTQPNPKGLNLSIVSNAGGPAIMAADQLVARGGKLADLTDETVLELKQVLPSYCSMKNPVDVYEEASVERFRKVLEICLKDQHSDGFLVVYTPQGASNPIQLAETIIELTENAGKPIFTALMSEDERCREARRILQRRGLPAFSIPEQAVSTFINMYNYSRNLELLYQIPQEIPIETINANRLKSIIRQAFCEGRSILNLAESINFLEEYKIPVVKTLVAHSPEEAETFSSQLGYPVVMKALSLHNTHKSKIEGVILNVCSPADTSVFFKDLAEKVKHFSFSLDFQGVAIQPMVKGKGQEFLIGAKKDPNFGSVILFGRGGTLTEVFRQVSLGFPPLNQVLAGRVIEDSGVFKGALPVRAGVKAELEEILVRFSHLLTDFPEIKEIDVNPVIVTEQTTVAVDARIVIDWERVMREFADHKDQLLIATYPKEYIATRRLKDGTEVVLRPIKAEDEVRYSELIKSLSPQSMRFRFFEIIKEMPHDVLMKFCNVDYDRQIAIVAELERGGKQIVGAGRVIAEHDGASGEFAVLVTDKWQLKGLGELLMDYIIMIAKNMRLAKIFATVLPDNIKMINLAKKKGFKVENLDEETVKASFILSNRASYQLLNFCNFCSISLSPSASPAHVAIMPSTSPTSCAAFSSTVSMVAAVGHPIILTVSTFLAVPTKKYA